MIVVNLAGAPGSGKSTGAAYIFARLKMAGINCEMAREFAKGLCWQQKYKLLKKQRYIFKKQSRLLSELEGKVDIVLTDSPLILSVYYGEKESDSFKKRVIRTHWKYHNLNYFVQRSKAYNPAGRLQSEEEARRMQKPIQAIYDKYKIDYKIINGNISGYDEIFREILAELEK